MLYRFVKVIARTAIRFYCRDLQINRKELLSLKGPLMLAANHPNSFLDAIILCTIFDQPVYSLARGDAFNGKFISKILVALKLLPVYRVSEGVENLEENYKTFDQCKEIFKQDGVVLIFSEGRCVNEWHLRPLKKGTARLAISSWADGIPLKVLPVAINYSSFEKFGKNVRLFFGEFITVKDVDPENGSGRAIQAFNTKLQQQLSPHVFEIDQQDKQQLRKTFYVKQSFLKRIVLMLPAAIGWLLHAPIYYPLKSFVTGKTNSTDHYDSLVVAILFLAYPIYLVVLSLLVFLLTDPWYALLFLAFVPATAWSLLQVKEQL